MQLKLGDIVAIERRIVQIKSGSEHTFWSCEDLKTGHLYTIHGTYLRTGTLLKSFRVKLKGLL